MPAKSKNQRIAANIAHAIKKGKVEPKAGTASANMANSMTDKQISHFQKEGQGTDQESLKVVQAINVLANYIVKKGDTGTKNVERLLKMRIDALKKENRAASSITETIRSMVKEVLNEMNSN